ncbi:putative CheW protein [Paenibacillus mucilaginosus 3016]|uniref:Chemotaxis protein CheW n=2 Tax=Paenibacillus mucilaginosus TaxID=61624 RepID=I0BU23_9BACL|nr:chemotaxis protein CheW [Paenibacillus mucilaginosus]AFC33546.1 putative CheW protein [Paenibacillus mucilaginosus 3016]AFH65870.1 chemotaxis protein CheW [Paenibacillus mucilaginosus K02]WFA21949.1 chemotaxis protein CheW [Paenibacillus mucilaginosus]
MESQTLEAIICRIGSEKYAISAQQIKSIVPVTKITPVLKMPTYVLGVMKYENKLHTIIDLRHYLVGSHTTVKPTTRIIIIGLGDKTYGLMVEEAYDFTSIPIKNMDEGDLPEERPYIQGFVTYKEELVCVLKIRELMEYIAQHPENE